MSAGLGVTALVNVCPEQSSPRVLLPTAGVPSLSPGPGLKQETTETPQIKEEPEEQSVKQEEEQLPVCVPESSAVCVKREEEEEFSGEDISSEPHFHSETEGHTELSSDTDNDDNWEPFNQSAAKSTGLFPKKSAPETSASVNNGHKSGAAGAEGKKHQCPFCQKIFGFKSLLEIHITVHTGERPYSCPLCEKTFSQKSNLSAHLRIHTKTERKKHQCSVCNKTFVNKYILKTHFRIHSRNQPFSCTVCTDSFNDKPNLHKHMKIHTEGSSSGRAEKKKHHCSVCRKTFGSKTHLQIHNRLHTGEKPFSCPLCTKAFTQKHHVASHMKRHTRDIAFNCSLCEMDFTDPASLKEHLKTHPEENQRKQQLLDSAPGPRVLPRADLSHKAPPVPATTESTQEGDERGAGLEPFCASLESGLNNDAFRTDEDLDAEKDGEMDETFAPQDKEESQSESDEIRAEETAPGQKRRPRSCGITCKKQCNNNIAEDVRQRIFKQYKDMTYYEKKLFILQRVTQHKPKRTSPEASRRSRSLRYTLNNSDGRPHEVCKTFFLTTLGYHPKNDRLIVTVMTKSSPTSLTVPQETRGRQAPANKLDTAPMLQHIESFQTDASQAPKRRYLPSSVTIRSMYEDYVKKNRKCSYEAYRKVVKERNIVFSIGM